MNPVHLQKLLKDIPEDIVVDASKKTEFLDSSCIAAYRRDVLMQLDIVWESMLKARCWDEFCELRGAYRAMVRLLDLPGEITTADGPKNVVATPPEDVNRALDQMKEILDGNQ